MQKTTVASRFRGFLPVVVDVETGGFNAETDALLEIAAVLLAFDDGSGWRRDRTLFHNIKPFEGANLDAKALEFNKIDPHHPFRGAVAEALAIVTTFDIISDKVMEHGCSRAILVGHNPFFDLSFLKAASERCAIQNFPFHHFSTFDTAALSGVAFGQTVLAKAVRAAGLEWDGDSAHSAIYDAERTAELFCRIVNRWDSFTAG